MGVWGYPFHTKWLKEIRWPGLKLKLYHWLAMCHGIAASLYVPQFPHP